MIRSTCRECAQREDQSARTTRTRIREVEGDIVTRRVLSAEAAGILHSAPDGRTLFNRVYTAWSLAGALDEPAVLALVDLMNALRLRAEDVGFEDRVRPFLYQDRIRKRLPLPVINPLTGLNPPLSLFPGELVHYYAWAALSETRVSGRRYVGGRRHTGGPPRRGTLRHALSGTRGDIVEDVEWASVAQGTLLLTNYRLLLHPAPPGRPVSIPLSSVLSLAWGKDTMTIQRRDRQSPHIFTLRRGGPIEIFQLCLDYLLRR